MLNEIIPIIKNIFEIDELIITDQALKLDGFHALSLYNTPYYLFLPKHLSTKSIFNIKRLIEISLANENNTTKIENKYNILKGIVEKAMEFSDESLEFTDMIKNSFLFAENTKMAIYLENNMIKNSGIDEQVLHISLKKLEKSFEFETYLGDGEHIAFSGEFIKLIVISDTLIDPFIKWAMQMRLLWLDHIYIGHLELKEKTKANEKVKMMNKFVAMVAHDLRSPFTGIIGILQILKKNVDQLSQQQEKLLTMALNDADKLLEMINQLLKMNLLNDIGVQLKPQYTQTKTMVESIFDEFRSLSMKKNVHLINNIPSNHKIYVDYDFFSVVLRNLISNAIKFSNKGDSIEIFDSLKDTIIVKDTGVGINPEILNDLFKREIKTSLPGTEGEEGTGFGLPLCKDIVQAHNGELSVTSSLGKGTQFTITLPESSSL